MTGVGLIGLTIYAVKVIGEQIGALDGLGMLLVIVGTSVLGCLGAAVNGQEIRLGVLDVHPHAAQVLPQRRLVPRHSNGHIWHRFSEISHLARKGPSPCATHGSGEACNLSESLLFLV